MPKSSSTAPAQPQPRFIVPLGRGARGKTFWTRWAVERAHSEGREVEIADADRTNATLSAYFPNVISPPSGDDRDVGEWLKDLIDRQILERFTVVLDLGGGDLVLKRTARELELVNLLGQHGIRPVAVHLLGADQDDLAYLQDVETNGVFAPEATILILNQALVPLHRTPAAAFRETVQSHPILAQTLTRGAKLISLPRLEPAHDIDLRRLTFAGAEGGEVGRGSTPLGPIKRQQTAIWRRAMEAAFAPVAEWLP